MFVRFPPFGFHGRSHAQLTPNERPHLKDGIISVPWNAGTLHVQYVALQEVPDHAVDIVIDTMWHFAIECQQMVVLFAGVLANQKAVQSQIGAKDDDDKVFAVTTRGNDGNVDGVWAWLPQSKVFRAFSTGGEFETTFAKAFVISAYQLWEEYARPNVARALGISHKHVRSDLMGEWRHLRNWLVHPNDDTETKYFESADLLAKIPGGPQPGEPTQGQVQHGAPNDGLSESLDSHRESVRPVTRYGDSPA